MLASGRRAVRAGRAAVTAMTCFTLTACGSSLPRNRETLPGTYRVKMRESAAGSRRRYLVHVPAGYRTGQPLPLVVVLHGAFSSGREMELVTGFSDLADREGFLVAYPNGIGLAGLFQHWNAGFCCAKAMRDHIDDVGFVARVVDEVAARLAVDLTRVFLVGNSNGGMLAYRIAALRPGLVAAVAVAGASIGLQGSDADPTLRTPDPEIPVSVAIFHGRADANVPYQGGVGARGGSGLLSVDDSVRFWTCHDRCAPEPTTETLCGGAVLRQTWSGADPRSEVVLYSIDGWGHDWPGRHFTARLGRDHPLFGLDAAELMWQFFERQSSGTRAD